MAEPTLADVIARLVALKVELDIVKLQNSQQTNLILALTEGVQIMSTAADTTKTTVDALDTKVDTLIGLIQPGLQALRDQLAAAQTQIAALQAGDAADVTTLQTTIAAAQAEADKVDAAIAALTPPPVAG